MPRLRLLAWSGVRSGVQDGTSDVTSGAQGAQSDVRSGAQAQVQLPAQLSNSTGWAKALVEPAAPPPANRNGGRRRSPVFEAVEFLIKRDLTNETC